MSENIGYRWETKDEQEKKWKVGDDCIDNNYRREIEFRKKFDIYDFNDFADNIYSCYLHNNILLLKHRQYLLIHLL